jgi:hypothetical protein
MITRQPQPSTPWPSSPDQSEPLERALEELVQEDQWIDDFIKRLNCAIADVVRKK